LESNDRPPRASARSQSGRIPASEISHDAEELSALSALMQYDLSQLRKGVLSKELEQKLRKMEKLAKKLRQEVSH
jgi:hypothetical protein